MGSQPPMALGSYFQCKNALFDHSRSNAPKLALVPENRQYCDKCICFMMVCGKSHQD